MTSAVLEKRIWWGYIHQDLQELLRESVLLINTVGKWSERFNDYAFIVFPAAKAYEGFLKTLFRDLGFISDETYFGKRFRVGKALNPALENHYREESIYDMLENFCQGKELPDKLWETWKRGRNMLFHWFPNESNVISYGDAKQTIFDILDTMDFAFKECKIKRTPDPV